MTAQVPMFEKSASKLSKQTATVEDLVAGGFDLKKFVENFEVLAEADGGIKRLRELTLELAIRGRLSSAHEAAGVAGDPKHDDGLTPTPGDWKVAPLGDVAAIVRGITFPASAKQKVPAPGLVPCLRTTNVQRTVEWHDLLYVPPSFVGNPEQWVRAGDLCISMANSYELVGKVAQVVGAHPQVTFGGFLGIIRPNERLSADYLTVFMRSPTVQAELRKGATQTTNIANISLGRLRPLPVSIPPLPEQKRIVAKVDELMKLIDDMEAKQTRRRAIQTRFRTSALDALVTVESMQELTSAWERMARNFAGVFGGAESIADLRRTVLGLACRGALTQRGSHGGTGEEVVRQIEAARKAWAAKAARDGNGEAARVLKKVEEQEGGTTTLPVPTTWATSTLLAACCQLVDCHNKTAPYTSSGVMLVRTSNIRGGKIRLEGVNYVSEETYNFWSRRCPPAPGDLLFTREAPMGEVGLVEQGMRLCMGQRTMLLRTFPDLLDPSYLLLTIQDPAFQARMKHAAVGSTVKHLRVGDVESLVIPVPPLAEQKRIVAKVAQLMKLCDELEAQLKAKEGTASKLVEAVVKELVA